MFDFLHFELIKKKYLKSHQRSPLWEGKAEGRSFPLIIPYRIFHSLSGAAEQLYISESDRGHWAIGELFQGYMLHQCLLSTWQRDRAGYQLHHTATWKYLWRQLGPILPSSTTDEDVYPSPFADVTITWRFWYIAHWMRKAGYHKRVISWVVFCWWCFGFFLAEKAFFKKENTIILELCWIKRVTFSVKASKDFKLLYRITNSFTKYRDCIVQPF